MNYETAKEMVKDLIPLDDCFFEKIAEEVGHKSVLTTMLNYSFDTQDDAENKRLINKGLNIHTA